MEGGKVLFGNRRQHVASHAQREFARKVFLDGHRLIVLVVGEIDKGKAANGKYACDAVVLQLVAIRQRLVGLRWHAPLRQDMIRALSDAADNVVKLCRH
jgi:hypothetical protein